jgi:hypothetical protein
MLRTTLRTFALCIAVAGCAGAPAQTIVPALGVSLACSAPTARVCPSTGCSAANPGHSFESPISLTLPAFGDTGQVCRGSVCESAHFGAAEPLGPAWTSDVSSGPDGIHPVGLLAVTLDRRSFSLTKPASDGAYVWFGACAPAGS